MQFRVGRPNGRRLPFLGDLRALSLKNPAQTLAECCPYEIDIMETKIGRTRLNLAVSGELTEYVSSDKFYEKDMPYGTYALQRHGGQGLFCGNNDTEELEYFTNKLRASLSLEVMRKRHRVLCEIIEIELKKLKNPEGQIYVNVPAFCTRLTLEILLVSLFGITPGQAYDDAVKLIPAIRGLLSEVSKNIVANKLPVGKDLVKKYIFSKYSSDIDAIFEYVRLQHEQRIECPITERLSIIDFYLYDENLNLEKDIDIENLHKQLVTLIVAGHETTGNAIAFTIRDMLQNESVMKNVANEAKEKIGTNEYVNLTFDSIQRMPYIEACFYESLRINPTAPAFHRKLKDNSKVSQTVGSLPGSVTVLLNSVNKDREYWGAEAEIYNPDRFYKKSLPGGFKPFGAGARSCTGRHLSVYEAKLVLSALFSSFRMDLCENTGGTIERLTAAPDNFMVEFFSLDV